VEQDKVKQVFQSSITNPFLQGCKASIPIAVGYIPIAITFGLVAKSAGIPDHITLLCLSWFLLEPASL
jgi:predicted branched-subunit amino acid permease